MQGKLFLILPLQREGLVSSDVITFNILTEMQMKCFILIISLSLINREIFPKDAFGKRGSL